MERAPFIPEHIYKRSEIHDQYGLNRQKGISASAAAPYIFIFSGATGGQYGYKDRWDNPAIFSYTGEGQTGDMKFTSGNLALRDHLKNEKRVFLFEYVRKAFVKFVTEVEFFDIGGFPTLDVNNNMREAIRFFFKRKGAYIPVTPKQLDFNYAADYIPDFNHVMPNTTERAGLVTSRVGQGAYRKRIIHRWEYECAVTKFNKLDILIASHIVPWAGATDTERLDVHNGILLSPTYDALFDRNLISFDHKGKILLSDSIDVTAYEKIGVTGREVIQNLSQYNLEYLDRHQEVFLKLGTR